MANLGSARSVLYMSCAVKLTYIQCVVARYLVKQAHHVASVIASALNAVIWEAVITDSAALQSSVKDKQLSNC